MLQGAGVGGELGERGDWVGGSSQGRSRRVGERHGAGTASRRRHETLTHFDSGRESPLAYPARAGPRSAPAITFLPSNAKASLWIGLAPTARSSAA